MVERKQIYIWKKIYIVLFSLLGSLIFMSCGVPQKLSAEKKIEKEDSYQSQIAETKPVSLNNLENIFFLFGNSIILNIAESGDVYEGEAIYEDYYGGIYWDKNELVVFVTDDFESTSKYNQSFLYLLKNGSDQDIIEAVKKFKNMPPEIAEDRDFEDVLDVDKMNIIRQHIKFKTVNYSINMLYEYEDSIANKFDEYHLKQYKSDSPEHRLLSSEKIGYRVDEENNCLAVNITNLTDEKIDTFYSLFGDFGGVPVKFSNSAPENYDDSIFTIPAE